MTPPFVTLIAGTRPNFMKIAPIRRALDARQVATHLIHTGQHFDATMSDVFFRDLGMREPDVKLAGGGGSHAEQTASILVGIEKDLIANRPNAILVVGDVTSTFAGALAASKLGIPVIHVEAGLRSRDWTMPEEINRVLTDQLSDLLLLPSLDAKPNLQREGIADERLVFVGNVMIDSLHFALTKPTAILSTLKIEPKGYALVTLHRPANVDTKESLEKMIGALTEIGSRIHAIFPVHPRTLARIDSLGMREALMAVPGLRIVEPLGYNDFVTVMKQARFVATDSGGIQEETTALGVPCLTLREGTERPVTITDGTNVIVGLDREKIAAAADRVLSGEFKKGSIPEGWDGRAGDRVAEAVIRFLEGTPAAKTVGARA